MRRKPGGAALIGLAAALVLCAAACKSSPRAVAPVCPAAVCKLSRTMRWSVAINPPADSALAPTQVLNAAVVADGPPFQVDSLSQVVVTMSPPAGAGPIPPQTDILLSVPSAIPGLPDLSFQAPGTATPSGGLVAALMLPSQVVRATPTPTAQLTLQPLPPGDPTLPAYRWSALLGASITLPIPGDDVLIHGQLLSAGNQVLGSPFVARAFQNGLQVSNAPAVRAADGQFEIKIPAAVVAANPVTLALAPSKPPINDPWFVSTPFTASPGQNLGTINLPAYVPPGIFTVRTQADDSTKTPLAGILISALTPLGDAVVSGGGGGSASFQNTAVTDGSGIAQLSLLPGTNNQIPYFVLATPPIGSQYAIQCVNRPAGAGSQVLATITLGLRPVLTGKVVQLPNDDPVANVAVTATGTPDPPSSAVACRAPSPISIATTTDAEGLFALPLDAGTYRIDYDPTPGTLAPRKTTAALKVTAGMDPQVVTLEEGTWLTGSVESPAHTPVASASIRFFEACSDPITCPGSPVPNLVAATFTDALGHFQVAVPLPAAAAPRSAGFDTAGAGP